MARSSTSVKKRTRQNIKKEIVNKALKNQIRTCYKKILEANENKNKNLSEELLRKYFSLIDNAAKKKVLHKNNCSRKKSAAMRLVNLIQKNTKEKNEENA